MAYFDYKGDVNRLVVGPRSGDPLELDGQFHGWMSDFYSHSLFFVPSGRLLKQHVKPITEALDDLIKAGSARKGEVSAKGELNALARGEPISLNNALRMDRTMKLLAEKGDGNIKKRLKLLPEDPDQAVTPERVEQSLSERGLQPEAILPRRSFRIPALGIIPSVYKIVPERLKRIHTQSKMNADQFSALIFGGNYEDSWTNLIYQGHRVTRHLGLAIASRARQQFAEHKGLSDDDFKFEVLFNVPRGHKSEIAISTDEGNMVPGKAHYGEMVG